jgi:hypothetical protein
MEDDVVVETIAGEEDEVVDGLRRPFDEEVDVDVAMIGLDGR